MLIQRDEGVADAFQQGRHALRFLHGAIVSKTGTLQEYYFLDTCRLSCGY